MMYNEKEEITLMDILIGRPAKIQEVVDAGDFLNGKDEEEVCNQPDYFRFKFKFPDAREWV